MQMEMEMGYVHTFEEMNSAPLAARESLYCQNWTNDINRGKIFFDLFVAMCNHVDDLVDAK
jgi:hypothetical protein